MPSLLSFTRGKVTGLSLDLSTVGFWRVELSPVMVFGEYGLGITYVYPPAGPTDRATLFGVSVKSLSEIPEDERAPILGRIAFIGLETGELEKDLMRIAEAYSVIKNTPRPPRGALVDEDIERAKELVGGYWKLRDWVYSGCKEETTIEVNFHVLRCLP